MEETNNVQWYKLDNETLQRLKEHDPRVTHLSISLEVDSNNACFFNSIDWEMDGDGIAKNKHLNAISMSKYGEVGSYYLGKIGADFPTKQQLQAFFSCIHKNKSITCFKLSVLGINYEFGWGLIERLSGHHSLKRLEISRAGVQGINALWKVVKDPKSKLEELFLLNNDFGDDEMRLLCDALLVNNSMKTLSLKKYSSGNITSCGWNELSKVLRGPNCKLVHLDLFGAGIYDNAINTLGNALRGSSVKALDLSNNKFISSAGWKTLFNQLAQTSIESLDLKQTKISDSGLAALAGIGTLKSLDLYDSNVITPTGWRSFFNLLETRGIQLKKLDISWNKIGDGGISGFGRLLSNTNTLKSLHMNGMSRSRWDDSDNITSQSWISFFTTLQDSNLDLAELDIHYNQIDDEGLQLLIRFVSSMTSLKELNLSQNRSVTPTGWQALTGILQSPNLALRKLDLDSNNINDDTLVALTSALANNKTLKRLALFCPFGGNESVSITSRGWSAVSTLLCNKTSIMDTHTSNHTLHKLIEDDDYGWLNLDLPYDIFQDIVSSLKLNNNKDKVEVARQKILQTHFSTEDDTSNMQELLGMELEMMPAAISWIGRTLPIDDWKGKNVSGLSLLYNLMRRLPDLFDSSLQKKKPGGTKRKRDS